jgi:ParB/RepB/Spo0J family partition protein
MAEKTKVVKEQNKLKNSSRPTYDVNIRSITGNTNPRNPLSNSLQSQGWDCMFGEKQVWSLAVSDHAEGRARYVQLIQDFDPELASLAATILSQGLLEPVEVCEGGGGKFRLVFGARRCLAILFNWCLLGKPKEPIVQAFLQKGNATTLLHRAVVENIRKPQSVIEVARAIKIALNNGEGKDEIGRQLGMSLSTVDSRLKLLELEPKEQAKIHAGEVTVKDAKRIHAEKNGKATPASDDGDKPPPLRKRKEIEAALEEFAETKSEYRALAWVLGLREKIG